MEKTNGVRQFALETKVDDFVKEITSMVNNHTEREKRNLTLVFRGTKIPPKRVDCYADSAKVERKLYKLSTTPKYSRMVAELSDDGEGSIVAYISF